MTTPPDEQVHGRTRWRRFVALMVPALAVAGAVVFGMANGAIAASFSISGQQFKVSADHLHGDGFRQYGGVNNASSGKALPVATSVIGKATLTNLCQSVVLPGPFGKVVLRLEAGKDPNNPATANNLVIGVTDLRGNATFTDVTIGRDGGELGGSKGTFGQSAAAIDISNLRQTAYSTTAGTFSLKGLSMQVLTGDDAKECY